MRNSNYGITEKIKNCIFLVKTKLFFKKTRLVRFPIVIRGKKYIDFGEKLTTGYNCRIEVNGDFQKGEKRIVFGSKVNIGDNVRISSCDSIKIGNNVLMGSRVLIIDNSHGCYSGSECDSPMIPPNERKMYTAPIVIEDNVWLGDGVVVQKGVTIGKGAIVGANSVVTGDVLEYTIVGGIPAKEIKRYSTVEKTWKNDVCNMKKDKSC